MAQVQFTFESASKVNNLEVINPDSAKGVVAGQPVDPNVATYLATARRSLYVDGAQFKIIGWDIVVAVAADGKPYKTDKGNYIRMAVLKTDLTPEGYNLFLSMGTKAHCLEDGSILRPDGEGWKLINDYIAKHWGEADQVLLPGLVNAVKDITFKVRRVDGTAKSLKEGVTHRYPVSVVSLDKA